MLRGLIAPATAIALLVPAAAHAAGTGAIAGHVTAASGPVCVVVLDAMGQRVAHGPTQASGDYMLGGVPTGTWTVQFLPDFGCNGVVTDEAFQYAGSASTPASSTPITVVAGATQG